MCGCLKSAGYGMPRRRARARIMCWLGDIEGAPVCDGNEATEATASDCYIIIGDDDPFVAAGWVGSPPAPPVQAFTFTVNVPGRLAHPEQFGNIIVKSQSGEGGRITRVRDVSRVQLGGETCSQCFRRDTRQAAGIAVFQLPGANALNVAGEVRTKLK